MRYAALGGGKRLRPFLVVAGARLFGTPDTRALRAAAAVEMIHCYSLVHDDLPAMDDDSLRRGRPTCHIAYGEATAILAGDGLLTHAFTVMADPATHPDGGVRADLVAGLAGAAGPLGMVAGQMMDMNVGFGPLDAARVQRLQALKTGALIAFAAEAGAILGQAGAADRAALAAYGRQLGAAFQIIDDVLDATGSAAKMGKAVGKDAEQGKATLVAALGLDPARAAAHEAADRAIAALDSFREPADPLRAIARFVIDRET
ncbi:MAG: polyprenyl synthetase family protein [Alphaproteobacteria bacterium]|nr:polyprenyl synthetase family protein [Alphaproteobacteria bacterium]